MLSKLRENAALFRRGRLRPLANRLLRGSRIHLFILCPRFSGSTLVQEILRSSPHATVLPREGQWLPECKGILGGDDRWEPDTVMDWRAAAKMFDYYWDPRKPVRIEKSPPNLLRAAQLNAFFPNTRFIINIRNPYATVEGELRRGKTNDASEAAAFWLLCAETQRSNANAFKNALFFRYEDLVSDPSAVCERLLAFLPQLGSLDASVIRPIKNVRGEELEEIVDLNAEKIARLTKEQIAAISAVLRTNPKVPEFFGYEILG